MIEKIKKSLVSGIHESYRNPGNLYTTELITYDLLNYIINENYKATKSNYAYTSDYKFYCHLTKTMKRVINQMIIKHSILFDKMINKLDLFDPYTYEEIISQVWDMDNRNNWGRVVSIFAFCSRISQHFKDNGLTEKGSSIWESISQYIVRMISQWIHNNGGWVRTK